MPRKKTPPQAVSEWLFMRAEGKTNKQIAEETGYPIGTVSTFLGKSEVPANLWDASKFQASYKAPTPRENDDRKHLGLLYQANGYGFAWLSEPLAERVYSLEVAPPMAKLFWRAA